MKKALPYILIGLIVLSVIGLFIANLTNSNRTLDERVSMRKRDKIPYGLFVAFDNLKYMFPDAEIVSEKQEPGNWDSIASTGSNQALIIISPGFNADEIEFKRLINFVKNGNDVFVSAMRVSDDVEKLLKSRIENNKVYGQAYNTTQADSMTVSLKLNDDDAPKKYQYPGRDFGGRFTSLDSSLITILGYDEYGKANFVHLKAGEGNLYLHLAPMAFTNYFLLYRENMSYYEHAISLIPASRKKVLWDEYYLSKPFKDSKPPDSPNWLSVLMNLENENGKKPFKTAIWLSILLLLAYVLFEMRRKQRIIPVIKKPKNDVLDFIKTIGRLYYDKGDHKNLAKKMSAFFLEHVRSRYKLPTNNLNEEFVKTLQYKTGIEEQELQSIITFINELDGMRGPSDKQLVDFHKQLESFYKTA